MKNLLACLAILAAFNVTAQVDGFQLPYNPDSEPDGYIGVGDVLQVLAIFGSQWNASDIYLNDDSTTMVMNVGQASHLECLGVFSQLPGNWRIPSLYDYSIIIDEILSTNGTQQSYWYQNEVSMISGTGNGWVITVATTGDYSYASANPNTAYYNCYCSTHERPKVEYSSCTTCDNIGASTATALDIQSCTDLKVQEGWYPLGGVTASGNNTCINQVFWRWAD